MSCVYETKALVALLTGGSTSGSSVRGLIQQWRDHVVQRTRSLRDEDRAKLIGVGQHHILQTARARAVCRGAWLAKPANPPSTWSVFVQGSIARIEVSPDSDVDLFVLSQTAGDLPEAAPLTKDVELKRRTALEAQPWFLAFLDELGQLGYRREKEHCFGASIDEFSARLLPPHVGSKMGSFARHSVNLLYCSWPLTDASEARRSQVRVAVATTEAMSQLRMEVVSIKRDNVATPHDAHSVLSQAAQAIFLLLAEPGRRADATQPYWAAPYLLPFSGFGAAAWTETARLVQIARWRKARGLPVDPLAEYGLHHAIRVAITELERVGALTPGSAAILRTQMT